MAPAAQRQYSLRDMVLAQREAFKAGILHREEKDIAHGDRGNARCVYCNRAAAEAYPLPKVTRPRVVKDSAGYEWRVNAVQRLEWRCGGAWSSVVNFDHPKDRLGLVAGLLANPTETVDAEE